MGIFDRFRSKKEKYEKPEEKTPEVRIGKKKTEVKEEGKKPAMKKAKTEKEEKSKREIAKRKVAKKDENLAHEIIFEPLVTEKSTSLGQYNKYVFKVNQKASKNHVRNAVQDFYGVGVTAVNIVKIHPKKRIHGRTVGYKKGYKKAIVTLQAGDTIGVVEGV